MPTLTDEAICVRHWDFSETSQTVSLFTREHGLLRGLAKGAKRERGRFSGGIDLLVRGRVIALTKAGRELATLTDWDLLEVHRHLREHVEANRAAFYMAELVCRLVAEDESRPRTYEAMASGLRALADPELVDATLLRFQWEILDEGGSRPQLEAAGSSEEDRDGADDGSDAPPAVVLFSPREGGVVDGDAARGAEDQPRSSGAPVWRVRRETIELLKRLADEGVIDPATGPAPRRAGRLLAAYLRELIGQEPSTLQAVYGEIRV